MLIIPAIDLIGGTTVRLTQGDYERKTEYGLDPVDVARRFEDEGAEWLHIVDLDGAKAGMPLNLSVLADIARATRLKLEFGGGLRDIESIEAALSAGAHRVVLGSRLAHDLDFATEIFATFGDRIVAGVDTRAGKVAVQGWLKDSHRDGIAFARTLVELGCQRVIWTDIARDGSLQGPNIDGLREFASEVPVPVIASGGVSDLSDIQELDRIADPAIEAVIVGKALYEGRFTMAEALGATRSVVS